MNLGNSRKSESSQGDKFICLDAGQQIAEGTPDEIVKNPDVERAYLGSDDG